MRDTRTVPNDAAGIAGRAALPVLLTLIAIKPLFDIRGETGAIDTLDPGAILTLTVSCSAAALWLLDLRVRRPAPIAIAQALILSAFVLLLVTALLADTRRAVFAYFDRSMPVLFGPYIEPAAGITLEIAKFVGSFGIIAAFGPLSSANTPDRVGILRAFLWLFLLSVGVHVVIAWLQLAGVVPYTFFFRFPGGSIGRASGGYFHPGSLGRLLIFAACLLPIARRTGLIARRGFVYVGWTILFATSVISTHRATILTMMFIMGWEVWGSLRDRMAAGRLSARDVRLFVLAAVLTLGMAAWVALDPGHPIRLAADRVLTNLGSLRIGSEAFLRGRGMIWKELFAFWSTAPLSVWILGLGYEPWNSHNDVLRLLLVHGFLGAAMIATALALLVLATLRRVAPHRRRDAWLIAIILLLAATTQKPTAYPYFIWLFVVSLAFIAASGAEPRSESRGTGGVP